MSRVLDNSRRHDKLTFRREVYVDVHARIEQTLSRAIEAVGGEGCPPGLLDTVKYAVFPGGARVRPRLCLAVAAACGDDAPALSAAVAAGIELMHCASLIHDDLPCFDDARMRRGRPAVHLAYGEPLALLAGDALIVLAFETLARAAPVAPERLPALLLALSGATGMPRGIVAGQAWECEASVCLSGYQQAKTGALFAAATYAGAVAAGVDGGPWRRLGERIGEAYQVADDIQDATADARQIGKDVGRDAALDRPNAVHAFGLKGAVRRLEKLLGQALESVPTCAGADLLRDYIVEQATRLKPVSAEQPLRVVA
jgi:geranylgeranyl diphosphate synthase type II